MPNESERDRVRREYAYALHTFPVTGQMISQVLMALGFLSWVLVPIEIWNGHWALAAIAFFPNFLMARTVVLLFPYAHADAKDQELREDVALLVEMKNEFAAQHATREVTDAGQP